MSRASPPITFRNAVRADLEAIPLGGIGTELPLAEIYERVTLPAPETE